MLKPVLIVFWQTLKSAASANFQVFKFIAQSLGQTLSVTADVLVAMLWNGTPTTPRPTEPDYEAKLRRITDELNRSGSKAQELLDELQDVISARTAAVGQASASLLSLQLEESELEERVSRLKAVEPESAKLFNELLDSNMNEREKRSGRRDWILYGLGVLSSVVVGLIFQWIYG